MKTAVNAELVEKVQKAFEGIGRGSDARFTLTSELEIIIKDGKDRKTPITISAGLVEVHFMHLTHSHKPSTTHNRQLTRIPTRFVLFWGKSGTMAVSDILDGETMVVTNAHNNNASLRRGRTVAPPLDIN